MGSGIVQHRSRIGQSRADHPGPPDLAEPKVPEAAVLTRSGQPDLRIYDRLLTGSLATAGGMMDRVIKQERIGELCGQFKLPTMGAQSVARFTAAGHGDALPIGSSWLGPLPRVARSRETLLPGAQLPMKARAVLGSRLSALWAKTKRVAPHAASMQRGWKQLPIW